MYDLLIHYTIGTSLDRCQIPIAYKSLLFPSSAGTLALLRLEADIVPHVITWLQSASVFEGFVNPQTRAIAASKGL